MKAKLWTALAVPLLAASATLTVAPAAQANVQSASSCPGSPAWHNYDSGYGTVKNSYSSAPVHTGPAGDCTVVFNANNSVRLYYHCYVTNSSGNTWTHVRKDGTTQEGWIWDEYLDDGGALSHC